MSLRPTRRDWPDAIGAFGITLGATDAIAEHDWWLLLWIFIALGFAVTGYMARKTSDEWRDLYYTAKHRADRATWGGRLS